MTSFETSGSSAVHLLAELEMIVGEGHLLTRAKETIRYRRGFRFGLGSAIAVVRPGTLLEQWRVIKACVAADVIVIMQAANTGLTGGSTPDGDYDRDIVIISTLRMRSVQLIEQGRQVVCFPGSTLDQLEKVLKPLGREPHSVIGSSCIGASVLGGICNNSGGSLIKRGPAFTEMSLFAQMDEKGELRLINHLGIYLGDTAEEILRKLDAGNYTVRDVQPDAGRGSDESYATHVRDIDAPTPARYNADPSRLYEASGSAGRVAVFAVRLDTFAAERGTEVFYIGANDADDLTEIRRHMLKCFPELPIAAEYMHRDAFDVAARYGKDTFLMIRHLGTPWLPKFFALKAWIDDILSKITWLPNSVSDRFLHSLTALFPQHLPKRMLEFRHRFEHYLLLKVSASSTERTEDYLTEYFSGKSGDFFRCTDAEGTGAFLHRFAVAGAAVRYRAVHQDAVEDIVALDVALARNDREWFEELPENLDQHLLLKIYYGHFFCHVFHQDYIVRKGSNCIAVEHDMWKLLDQRGAEYPAEHNVGHLYPAKAELMQFYQQLDPCNSFNPGIGKTPRCKHWRG